MPDFKVHSEAGVIAGYGAGALSLYFLDKSIYLSGLIFLSTYSGSVFPDIDSDSGRTINIIFNIISVLGAFTAIIFLADSNFKYAFIIPPGVYLFIKFILSSVFKYFSRHRGIYHSVPMAVFLSLIVFQISYFKTDEIFGSAMGLSFLSGYLLHLVLDEIYSVYDVEQKKFDLKKSLGTALALKGINKFTTAFVYLGIFILVFINYNPLSEAFHFLKNLIQ
jgi:hypothetical protein